MQLFKWLESELILEKPSAKGSKISLRNHLKQVEKTLKRKPAQLADQPDFPKELSYIFDWFLELKSSDRITYTEIRNWSELTYQFPLAWEVDVLKGLDRVYWKVQNG